MLCEKIQNSMNEFTSKKGVLKIYLFDRQGTFLAEDSNQDLCKQSKEYGQQQIKELLKIAQDNQLSPDEVIYDLDETRICIQFLDTAIILFTCYSEAKMSSLKLAINDLCLKIEKTFSSQKNRSPKKHLHAGTSSFDKSQIPDVVETDPDFIIFLKKQLNKYNAPQATLEIDIYINKHNLSIDDFDAQNAYNLIASLAKYVPEEFRESFSLKTQEVIKQYF